MATKLNPIPLPPSPHHILQSKAVAPAFLLYPTLCNFTDIRYVVVSDWKTWNDARDNCMAMGGRLIEIRSEDEFYAARRLGGGLFWVGASYREVEGYWAWDSNEERVNLNEFLFSGIIDFDTGLNCLFVSGWLEQNNCDRSLQSVCEFN